MKKLLFTLILVISLLIPSVTMAFGMPGFSHTIQGNLMADASVMVHNYGIPMALTCTTNVVPNHTATAMARFTGKSIVGNTHMSSSTMTSTFLGTSLNGSSGWSKSVAHAIGQNVSGKTFSSITKIPNGISAKAFAQSSSHSWR